MDDKDAIPVLESELRHGTYPESRYPEALSLEILGSPEGLKELRKYCQHTDSTDPHSNLAAEALLQKHDYSCAHFMASGLSSNVAGYQQEALLYLKRVPKAEIIFTSSEEGALLRIALTDTESFMRNLATDIIEQVGSENLKARYSQSESGK